MKLSLTRALLLAMLAGSTGCAPQEGHSRAPVGPKASPGASSTSPVPTAVAASPAPASPRDRGAAPTTSPQPQVPTVPASIAAGGDEAVRAQAKTPGVGPAQVPLQALSPTAVAMAERLAFVEGHIARNFERSVGRLQKVHQANPEDLEVQALLAGALIDKGADKEAKRLLDDLVARKAASCLPHLFLGTLEAYAADLPAAAEHYRMASRYATLDIDRSLVAAAQGQVAFWQGDLEAATDFLKQGLDASVKYPRLTGMILQRLANLADLSGQANAVPVLLRRAMVADPKGSAAAQLLAYTLTRGRPQVGARAVSDAFVREQGGTSIGTWTQRLLVLACIASGDLERGRKLAASLYATLEAPWPQDLALALEASVSLPVRQRKQGQGLLGEAYAQMWDGRLQEAEKRLAACLSLNPENLRARFLIAALEVRKGHVAKATEVCKRMAQGEKTLGLWRAYLSLLQYAGRCNEVVAQVDHRKEVSLSSVRLRALLRVPWIGTEQRALALAVAVVSESSLAPGPEHLEMWRRLHRPAEASPAGQHAWDTW